MCLWYLVWRWRCSEYKASQKTASVDLSQVRSTNPFCSNTCTCARQNEDQDDQEAEILRICYCHSCLCLIWVCPYSKPFELDRTINLGGAFDVSKLRYSKVLKVSNITQYTWLIINIIIYIIKALKNIIKTHKQGWD